MTERAYKLILGKTTIDNRNPSNLLMIIPPIKKIRLLFGKIKSEYGFDFAMVHLVIANIFISNISYTI